MDISLLFFTSFLIAFSGAAMPGPLLTVTISQVVRRGFWAGPMLVLGHAVLELTLVISLMAGFSDFLLQDTVASIVKTAGGAFLLWMGYDILRSSSKIKLELESDGTPSGPGKNIVLSGILVSLSNPYWLMWWATIGLASIVAAFEHGYLGMASFYTGHILADLIWYSFIALVVSAGRRFLSARVYKGLLVICGVFLLYLGLRFLYSALWH